MSRHPYQSLPTHCFWRHAVAKPPPAEVDPVVRGKFRISRTDRVATAGSCFAQHIARHLRASGFNYWVTETAHPIVQEHVADKFNYGVFTARYGNIYTSRQLLHTLLRAYGYFQPSNDVWRREDGRLVDPFRPQIQPDGFSSLDEYYADREQHLAAIRRMVEGLDVFVFTLGLTEVWVSLEDGAAYPVCPGVSGGQFDPTRHALINLSVSDVIDDMRQALSIIRACNPNARFLLTVSPVPLVATAIDRSALVSTTYSKSVLRVACEELASAADVAYFPSYEIITGNYSRGRYFAKDLRSVTEEGVEHVMRLFMRHYADNSETTRYEDPAVSRDAAAKQQAAVIEQAVAVICDEEALDRSSQEPAHSL